MSDLPAHSRLGASSTHRWFHCPGSVKLIESLPKGDGDNSNEHSERGTIAHDVAAKCLVDGSDAWERIEADKLQYDREDADAVQVYLDAIRKEWADPAMNGVVTFIESRFHHPDIHPDFFGTADCFMLGHKQAQVWDYKHGVGVVVEVERNSQLMQYAVGALYKSGPKWEDDDFPVELNICQPRAFHPGGSIRSWWTSVGELKEWLRNDWLPAARRTESSDPFLQPGTWCNKTFCPARLTCPAIREMVSRIAATTHEDIKAMEDWELGLFATEISIAKGLAKTADDEIFQRLRAGKKVSGWKMVSKRADRTWKDAVPLEVEFGEDAYEKRPKSPAAVEKLVGGKAFVAKWAYKPDAGMTVARDDDFRKGEVMRSRDNVFSGKI